MFQPGTLFLKNKRDVGLVVGWFGTPEGTVGTVGPPNCVHHVTKIIPKSHNALVIIDGVAKQLNWVLFDDDDIEILSGENTEAYIGRW